MERSACTPADPQIRNFPNVLAGVVEDELVPAEGKSELPLPVELDEPEGDPDPRDDAGVGPSQASGHPSRPPAQP
jgi:hypothetical protein